MYFQSGWEEIIPPGFYKTLKQEIKMKKTIFMLPALALMLFAACSSEDAVTKDNTAQLNELPENAIGFDAYLTRTTTRAGMPGILTTDGANSTVSLKDKGFGVFGYYANGDLYSENATPNFMYNQQVTYTTDWTYEPVKYWPNEFGSSAISTGVDRVTFFAYAPYVGVDPTTGQLTSFYTDLTTEKSTATGITSLTRNGKSGDPYVRYVGAFNPDDCVDLCYGVAAADYKSSIGASDGANSINKGEPYLNVAKPEINSKIYFDFKHALAKLTVQIDADVDVVGHSDGSTPDVLDSKTRVWVRSITFDGVAQRGYLNLNSGMWYEIMDNNKISHASVTIHDGRRDGAEAIADDSYESPTGFNPQLIQDEAYATTPGTDANEVPTYDSFGITESGVTATYQNLFDGSGSLLVIPANEQLKVTIVYDVETADATLPTYLSDGVTKGSTIENKITKYITLGGTALKLESGNAYTLNLHLGMNSVKFDAKVSGWDEGSNNDVDLPANVPIFVASETGTAAVNVPYTDDVLTYDFGISGLNGGEAVTSTPASNGPLSSPTANSANASGLAIQSVSIANNATIMKQTGTITWTGASSQKKVALTVTQAPHPLELAVKAFNTTAKTISLKAGATPKSADKWNTSGVIKKTEVYRNGTKLENGDPTSDNSKFSFTPSTGDTKDELGTITLNSLKAGDVYTIVMLAGDADEETITWSLKEGIISFTNPSVTKNDVDAPFTNVLNNNGDGVVTYTSSKTSVATVNSSTGEVALVGPGITIITASVSNGEEYVYETNTSTYLLMVSSESAAESTPPTKTINVDKDATGSVQLTITGFTPNEAISHDPASTPSWFTISHADNADGAGNIVVTYTITKTGPHSNNNIIYSGATNSLKVTLKHE